MKREGRLRMGLNTLLIVRIRSIVNSKKSLSIVSLKVLREGP